MSCLPTHILYAFFNEIFFVPNISCGSCVTAFDIHFGRPHMICAVRLFSCPIS